MDGDAVKRSRTRKRTLFRLVRIDFSDSEYRQIKLQAQRAELPLGRYLAMRFRRRLDMPDPIDRDIELTVAAG